MVDAYSKIYKDMGDCDVLKEQQIGIRGREEKGTLSSGTTGVLTSL